MLKLEVRAQPSRLWTYASPLLAVAITLVIGVILFSLLGKDPVRGLQVFFWEPVKSQYALGELMVKATPLLLIALGLADDESAPLPDEGVVANVSMAVLDADAWSAVLARVAGEGASASNLAAPGASAPRLNGSRRRTCR